MGKLFVISGASGVGKGTVLKQVMERRSDLSFSVSATTRPPRPGEIDGFHYYFISKEQFEEMIREDAFLEYDAHNANYYGTPMARGAQASQCGVFSCFRASALGLMGSVVVAHGAQLP